MGKKNKNLSQGNQDPAEEAKKEAEQEIVIKKEITPPEQQTGPEKTAPGQQSGSEYEGGQKAA